MRVSLERLTEKQKKFIDEYFVKGNSATQAALIAGYTDDVKKASSIGCRMLKSSTMKAFSKKCGIVENTDQLKAEVIKHGISTELQERDAIQKANDIFQWKLDKLIKLVELNMPTGVEEDGNRYQYGVAIGAIAELNKMQGHYSPTKTVNIDLKADADMIKLKELSDKLLLEFKHAAKQEGMEEY